MFARKTGWPVIAAAIAALVLSACTQTGTGTQSPSPGASTSPVSKVLRMARQAEPFSPFVPWQIDDNPALFISVQVYDTLLRTTKDGTNVEAGLATKWTPLIVHDLSEGPRRFMQLEHACPSISPRTLSERLDMLERQGAIVRRSYPESPPRVEYELTDKGRGLLPVIREMRKFGHAWMVRAPRKRRATARR